MRRGRPRSQHNERIAEAVHRLSLWGAPQDKVFCEVGRAAQRVLGRADHVGRALGADRVEQIYKGWIAEQLELRSLGRYSCTEQLPEVNPLFLQRWRYTKLSLAVHRPSGSTFALACKLLRG